MSRINLQAHESTGMAQPYPVTRGCLAAIARHLRMHSAADSSDRTSECSDPGGSWAIGDQREGWEHSAGH